MRTLLFVAAVLCALPTVAGAERAERVDAAALFNAGTEALSRGDLGPAVVHLLAAHRIDPRARDIRTNLAIARARVEENQATRERTRAPSALAVGAAEAWRISAALAFAGALLAWMAALRPGSRGTLLAACAVFGAGFLMALALFLRAREESKYPEAVVVAPMLEVGPAPDERPLPPYLLGAGEVVRIGASRGELVLVRVSGNSIGWARRSGLWRVADAPRYTAKSSSRSEREEGRIGARG